MLHPYYKLPSEQERSSRRPQTPLRNRNTEGKSKQEDDTIFSQYVHSPFLISQPSAPASGNDLANYEEVDREDFKAFLLSRIEQLPPTIRVRRPKDFDSLAFVNLKIGREADEETQLTLARDAFLALRRHKEEGEASRGIR